MVANSASTGVMGATIADGVDLSDGLLDVVVVDLPDLSSVLGSVADVASGEEPRGLTRWRGRHIRIESDPRQPVLSDGEDAGESPVDVSVAPGAIGIVVPRVQVR